MSHDPIAYTYDADVHCPDCAEATHGRCAEHDQIACCCEDSEGNEPGVIAPWDEWMCDVNVPENLVCGTCGTIIEEYIPHGWCDDCARSTGHGLPCKCDEE